jgi:hypothetical protein
MARPLKIEYPGAYYHVMNRGNRREDIFLIDKDRKVFLDGLADSCEVYYIKLIISVERTIGEVA